MVYSPAVKLPENSIGISDIEAYRECGRRMSFGMRRHTARGEQSDRRTPEADVFGAAWARTYGSAIHVAIAATEDGYTLEDAVQIAWNEHGRLLDPPDLDMLEDDLSVYVQRDFPGTRTVAAEEDVRVPLFVHKGVQIYFRFKLDRLYERLDAAGVFVHVDYKSSKHPKSEKEVHESTQLWSYNFGIHEHWPEVDQLVQIYDQLRFGQIPTRKGPDQLRQIKAWLIKQATAILEDESWQADGLLEHSFNEWCPWCPILESCPVVGDLTDFSLTRIAALAPMRPKRKKDGTPSKLMEQVPLDASRLPTYVTELEGAKRARQVLERFEESVKELIRELPEAERLKLGYDLRPRTDNVFGEQAARALHERFGDRFYELVKITKTNLEANIVEDEDLLAWAISLADRRKGAMSVVARKE